MSDDALTNLVDKAINDPKFRQSARDDLEGTLQAHGISLSDEELAAVKDFQAQTSGMSDDEVNEMLAGNATRKQAIA